jgi:hypothetical protein
MLTIRDACRRPFAYSYGRKWTATKTCSWACFVCLGIRIQVEISYPTKFQLVKFEVYAKFEPENICYELIYRKIRAMKINDSDNFFYWCRSWPRIRHQDLIFSARTKKVDFEKVIQWGKKPLKSYQPRPEKVFLRQHTRGPCNQYMQVTESSMEGLYVVLAETRILYSTLSAILMP